MNCPKCGANNEADTKFCAQCGAPMEEQAASAQPEQNTQTYANYQPYTVKQPQAVNQTPYLVWSILVTIFCCLPLGIPAIVFAAKISGESDAAKAMDAARKSKMFSIIGAVVGGVVSVIILILYIVGIMAALSL